MDYLQPKFYRFSEDSIWLAEQCAKFAKGKPRTLLDVGSGCGVVGIEAANRIPSVERIFALEPQVEFAQALTYNKRLLRADVSMEVANARIENWISPKRFDLIVSNPPYFKEGEGRQSPDINRAMCRSFQDIDLMGFVEGITSRLSGNGEAFVLGHDSNPDVLELIRVYGDRVKVVAKRKAVTILNFFHK